MARDIEEFLRKAAERRRQQQAEKQGGAPKPTPRPQPVRQPPRRSRPVTPEIIEVVEVVDDDIVEAQPVNRRPVKPSIREQSVGSHVESHIDTSRIAKHADELGSLKAQMTDDIDEVKEKFDRDAKKFESKHATRDNTDANIVGQESSAIASDLIGMLRDPQSIRQAILVSEILKRPEFDDER